MRSHLLTVLRKKIHAHRTVLIIFACGVFLLVLPIGWTSVVERVSQVFLTPAGRYTLMAVRAVTGDEQDTPSGGALSETQQDRVLASIAARLKELEEENDQLRALRTKLDERIGLLPANVVGFDSLGLASNVIDRGSLSGVRAEAPVIVGVADESAKLAALDPKIMLASGALLGTIAYSPGPYTARVQLITRAGTGFTGWVVRLAGDQGDVEQIAKVKVEGTGKDYLLARMVNGELGPREGDLVILAEPSEFKLPVGLAVGTVAKITPRIDSGQLVDLTIRPYYRQYEVSRVHVLVNITQK